ncbi:TetR-like C-terminal domain-containing protein [Anaerosacchariphilus polymeriproducens]|uniref:Dihydroxyacetone kinase transcriptional activator DhaS n=1 Tax=Anaerosacchariphilus polymeriproducens TaxID=1812858 RepID=A0A371AY55_9FIRM|nr:TetR-like C-terminal domain-containing protein [Anaerosacchariphilus polymeriproducens]RDU24514.1 dihydroxyacetone kinase transcriptional activator DhaS [Anaerosacchariphilus polymeriproducens]
MASTYLTKLGMAEVLKNLMLTTPINKIRIVDITEGCHISRHTFYNHFIDIYDLLGWIYKNEIIEDLDDYCHYDKWKDGILRVLEYTLKNKKLCLNTYRSLGREHLEEFLYSVFSHVLLGVMGEIQQNIHVTDSFKEEASDFYANAFVGLFMSWLKTDLKESPQVFANRVDRMLEGNLVALFKRNEIE